MRFIQKQDKEPQYFTDWKGEGKFDLINKIKDINIKNKDLWTRFMKKNISVLLKKFLIDEQFGICCYCGQKLRKIRKTSGDNDFTDNELEFTFEHLKDKDKNRMEVLNYGNLLASCSGVVSIKNIPLPIKEGEIPEEIIISHGYKIEECKIISNENGVLTIKKNIRQCNNKKENKEIKITPLQTDCEEKFEYEILTGKITGVNKDAHETANILGLGTDTYENSYLEVRRLNAINDAFIQLIMGVSDTIDPSLISQAPLDVWENQVKKNLSASQLTSLTKELYDSEYMPDANGEIERFPFVRRYVYKTVGSF